MSAPDPLEPLPVVRGTKYENMRALLVELRTARPLLLYGDAWIGQIEDVLALPDDKLYVAKDVHEGVANLLLTLCDGDLEDAQSYLRRAVAATR